MFPLLEELRPNTINGSTLRISLDLTGTNIKYKFAQNILVYPKNKEKLDHIREHANDKAENENKYLFKVLENQYKKKVEQEIKKEILKKREKIREGTVTREEILEFDKKQKEELELVSHEIDLKLKKLSDTTQIVNIKKRKRIRNKKKRRRKSIKEKKGNKKGCEREKIYF